MFDDFTTFVICYMLHSISKLHKKCVYLFTKQTIIVGVTSFALFMNFQIFVVQNSLTVGQFISAAGTNLNHWSFENLFTVNA